VVLQVRRVPTYHLSVVGTTSPLMTHVVRGDDHISNTPKQVLLLSGVREAGAALAHVPLIMGADKKRLSKRHGATSVMEYERQGYVPEAMVNFLALLGWSPGQDLELLTKDELVSHFTLDGISTGNAVFNTEKLDWFNHQYLLKRSDDDLLALLTPWFERAGLWQADLANGRRSWFVEVLTLLRPRAKRLGEFVDGARPFLAAPDSYDPDGAAKHLSAPDIGAHLTALRDTFATLEPFSEGPLEQTLRAVAEQRGLKAGVLIHATRLAMTGRTVSPLFEMLRLSVATRSWPVWTGLSRPATLNISSGPQPDFVTAIGSPWPRCVTFCALIWVKMHDLSNRTQLARPLLWEWGMKSTLHRRRRWASSRWAWPFSSPLSAREMTELGSCPSRVSGLTEPGALLLWGTVLAGLARAFGRRSSSN
jgi:hypothetical protein